jgi:hypothetical protein
MDPEVFNIINISLAMSCQAGHISLEEYKQAFNAVMELDK